MRPARLIFFLILVVLASLAAALGSDRAVLGAAMMLVKISTPYRLELQGATLNRRPFAIGADLLLLHYQDPGSPPLLAIQDLAFEAPLGQLLRGTIREGNLSATNISVYLSEDGELESPSNEALLSPLARLPAKIDIDSVHLLSKRENLWIFPLLNISARHFENGALGLIGVAQVATEPVVLELLASPLTRDNDTVRLDIQAEISGRDESSNLSLEGRIDMRGSDLSYQLQLDGQYTNVGDFVKAFDAQAYPFSGTLKVDGELRGDRDSFVLRVRDLELDNMPSYRFAASGEVTQIAADSPVLNLSARGGAQDLAKLAALPAVFSRLLEQSEVSLRLGGTLETPTLSEADLLVRGSHGLAVRLYSTDQIIQLADSWLAASGDAPVSLGFTASTGNLAASLQALNIDIALEGNVGASVSGTLHGARDELDLLLDTISLTHPAATISGSAQVQVREERVKATQLSLDLSATRDAGTATFSGTIEDLWSLQGLRGALEMNDLALSTFSISPQLGGEVTMPQRLSGTATVERAAERLRLGDIDVRVDAAPGVTVVVSGQAQLADRELQGDFSYSLASPDADSWRELTGLPLAPDMLQGQLRLRPRYATSLATVQRGASMLQLAGTADLDALSVTALGLDIYATQVDVADFIPGPGEEQLPESASEPVEQEAADSDWRSRFPDYPLHFSLRVDQLRGVRSRMENLALLIDGENGRYLLKQLDASYAGGDLALRGVLDVSGDFPTFSLAGQGLRVPLAALTQDLGLQQSVQGELSLRGGLVTRGFDSEAWKSQLQGRLALAFQNTQISGAAYDLLMSNLLAWVVTGASREKQTTFDCTMAQFDFSDGVGRSDSLYLETPRMLATGKATVDLRASTVDVRLQPRSKTRAFQFPSAVKIRGPLNAPKVSASPLQATMDASAQALLLLPSLTLRLFGIGSNDEELRPCEARLQ